jgi:transposase
MEAKHFEAWLSVAIAIPTPAHLETPLLVDRAPRKDTLAKLRRLPASIGDPDPHVAQAIVTAARALQATQATAAQVLQEVEQQIGDHPYGPILMSFPAIGAKTAAEIAANLVDVHRFTVTKHPAKATRKLLGYGAETTKTGNSTSTKPGRGSRRSKSLLFLAVLNCLSNGTQPYASLYRRHKRSKTHFQAMYATAGKLAEHIFAALSSGQPFKPPPTPAPTDEPDTRIDQPAETPIDNSDT